MRLRPVEIALLAFCWVQGIPATGAHLRIASSPFIPSLSSRDFSESGPETPGECRLCSAIDTERFIETLGGVREEERGAIAPAIASRRDPRLSVVDARGVGRSYAHRS